jgi:guanosine-3',5'-bis(diphosphate) 3'-pyrophosphohydrolase
MSRKEGTDIQILLDTLSFATDKHATHRRKNKNKNAYIEHPIRVATILSRHTNASLRVLQAALLHDTIEDTNTTYEEIFNTFGHTVAHYVQEVTDDKSLEKSVRKELQVAHAKTISSGAKLIKFADKIANMEDLLIKGGDGIPENWNAQDIQRYVWHAKRVIDNLKEISPSLEVLANNLYNTEFILEGTSYPALQEPPATDPTTTTTTASVTETPHVDTMMRTTSMDESTRGDESHIE